MEKQIYIIGAGAIGKALAVFLQLNQQKVTLLRGSVNTGTPNLKKISVALEARTLEAEIHLDYLSNLKVLDTFVEEFRVHLSQFFLIN